jgi:mRNA interferase RelE/StbE
MTKIDGVASFFSQLEKLQPKVSNQIARKIFSLAVISLPHDGQKLKGYPDFYRVTCGEFRLVYRFNPEADTVIIILLAKRNDDEVYKLLKNLQG